MAPIPPDERNAFPEVGSRARRFKRFERDLRAWLATPEGRFAAWHAQRALGEARPQVARARR